MSFLVSTIKIKSILIGNAAIIIFKIIYKLSRLTRYSKFDALNIRSPWMNAGVLWDKKINKKIFYCEPDVGDNYNIVARISRVFCNNTLRDNGVVIPGVAPVWEINLSGRWKKLLNALRMNDSRKVLHLLSFMFRSDYIWGMTYGSQVDRAPHYNRFLVLNIYTQLVEMAEAMGIARVETPEQGVPAYEISDGGRRVIRAIEERLSIEIGFPEISAAYGIRVEDRLLVQGQLAHIYFAWKIRLFIERFFGNFGNINIVEIGGGYGGLCYWVNKICAGRLSSYSIVDLPSSSVVQAYFLMTALNSNKAVSMYDCSKQSLDILAPIKLFPHTEISKIVDGVDIVINQDSFPELPENEVDRYLDWIEENSKYFISLNQEAYSPVEGVPQVWVASRCAVRPRLESISRNRSWVRNGYVEEIYRNNSK